MASKLEKRAFFDWQKSSDEHIFSIGLLIGFFAIRNEFPENYKIWIYLILSVLIFLSGWGLIRTKMLELEYLKFLKDRRYQGSKFDSVKSWLIIVLYIILGAIIIWLAMNIWESLVSTAFNK